ncbi:MAG: peptidoglycan DD-metalloendopeptidase family protein [Fibrobacterota bacterium]
MVHSFSVFFHTRSAYQQYYRDLEGLRDSLSVLEKDFAQSDIDLDKMRELERFYRVKYGLGDIDSEKRRFGTGGKPSVQDMAQRRLTSKDVTAGMEMVRTGEVFLKRISYTDSMLTRLSAFVGKEVDYFNEVPSIWPVKRARIASGYGYRVHPVYKRRIFHDGIDIVGDIGDPIVAPADGICRFTGHIKGYGNTVELQHKNSGYYTRYAHMSAFAVEKGDMVKRGEVIGYVGNTGVSTGPHLHYEIRKKNRWSKTINPREFLPEEELVYD